MADGKVVIDTALNTDALKSGIRGLKTEFGGLSSVVKKLGGVLAAVFTIKALVDFGKQAIELGSNVEEVQNVVDVAFGDMAYKIEAFAETSIQQFGMSRLAAKKTASTYMAMARGMGMNEEAASDMAISLTGLSGDVASFFNISQELADTKLKSVFTGETETLKDLGVVMTQANLKAYALQEGINKDISAMSQAELVGLRYRFVVDQLSLAHGDFARTSDSWANQTRILSMQWQEFMSIIGQALIKVLAPVVKVLNAIVSSLIAMANTFNAVVGSLFGGADTQIQQTEQNASGVGAAIANSANEQESLTDATKKTAKAQKKVLAGFDELNQLSSGGSSGQSSGSGGGSVAMPDVSGVASSFSAAVNLEPDEWAMDWVEELKASIESGDWTGAGALLAEKLNGVVEGLNPEENGKRLGEKLDNAFHIAYGFVTAFDFGAIGEKAAAGINKMIGSIDFGTVGALLVRGLTGISDVLYGFFGGLDWGLLGKSIGDFLRNGIQSLSGWWQSKDWVSIGTEIYESLVDFFANLDPLALAISIAELVGSAILGFGGMIGGFFAGLGADIRDYFVNTIGPAFQDYIGEQVEWFRTNFIEPVANFFSTLGENIIGFFQNAWNSIVAVWVGASTWFYATIIEPIAGFFSGLWNGITERAVAAGANIRGAITNAVEGMKTALAAPIEAIMGFLGKVIDMAVKAKDALVDFFKAGSSENQKMIIRNTPGLTQRQISGAMPRVAQVSIPALAKGAVIPPNREFMAVLGEQKSGTNVEAPLKTIEQAVENVLSRRGGGTKDITLHLSAGRGFVRGLKLELDRESQRRGVKLVQGVMG